jgi:hypothetical protein
LIRLTVFAVARRSGRTFKPSAKIYDSAPSVSSVPAKRATTGSSTSTTRKRTSAPADTDIDTSSDGDPLFEDTVEDDDNDLSDLQECSDEDEDACLAAEELSGIKH